MVNTKIKIGKIQLKNPVIAASGTFGYGEELKDFFDINTLGAIITKTITLNPREGNPSPRIVETPSGMLNSIGLENKGLEDFIKNKAPKLKKLKTNIIASIAGFNLEEFETLTKGISKLGFVTGIELNLSCPNIEHKTKKTGCKLQAQDEDSVREIVTRARETTDKTLIVKLSPNVTDIKPIAKASEEAGADAISLINTVFGLAIDVNTKKPILANIVGGLSGPAIKPIALNFVREARSSVKIPIIGIGGIIDAKDAIEFIICGSSAVEVGTANFINPKVTKEIIDGIMSYLKKNRIKDINSLIGTIK